MASLRDQVWRRAKDSCEYCQLPQTCTVLPHEIDHIVAQKHRGENLVGEPVSGLRPLQRVKGTKHCGLRSGNR
jgi:hypothetical protein